MISIIVKIHLNLATVYCLQKTKLNYTGFAKLLFFVQTKCWCEKIVSWFGKFNHLVYNRDVSMLI